MEYTYQQLLTRYRHLTHDIKRCNDEECLAELVDERNDIERQLDEMDDAGEL